MRYLFTFFIVSTIILAQPSFTERTIEGDFNGAASVYAVDMDGDGDMDVVGAANTGSNDIAWFENNGSQSFTEHTIEGDFNAAISVYAVDMDGDGDMDVLGAAYVDDDIAWFENNGSQSFTEHTIEGDFDGANSVHAVDMDGDGDMDVLGAARLDHDIAWFENNGSQSFTKRNIEINFYQVRSVYAVDMDGDGDMDVVGAAYLEDDIAWFENNGSQSFTEHTIDGYFDAAISVYAVDMDGDGDMDVLGAAYFDYDIAWFENNGSQSFTERTIEGDFVGAFPVYAVDMDGDGDMDVVGAAITDDDIAWFENNGSQSFTEHTIEGDFDGAASVYAVDMDGDGDMDVLGAAQNDHDIAWFENTSITPSLPSWTAADIATSADGAEDVHIADMDNDGDMDIVSASYGDDAIAWYENNGAADPSWTAADIATSADGAISVFVADMDNDGDLDIVSASQRDHTIAWYENNGAADPSWTAADIATSAEGATSVFVADMDNDGDLDIVSSSNDDDAIAWYENNGAADPSWAAADIATSADAPKSVFVADMDNDGDLDIVSANYGEHVISWYENNGAADPSWTAADLATGVGSAHSVFVADMDNDGDMDIVSASFSNDKIAWYENNGAADPSWAAADIATSADGAYSVFVADMDYDGDMDIVSASYLDDAIAWYENNGAADPSWTARDIATSADVATSVFVADMDNDGDMDIVSSSTDDDAIAWYESKTTVVSGNAGFRMLSSPVAGTIYDELLAPFWTQGMTGANTTSGTANVWTYNAATSAWAALTNLTTNSYTAGSGILIYVYTDVDGDGDDDIAGGVNVGIVNGTENSATVSISTTASAWNLLGNPFVSTIDADQLFSDNSNYTAVVYVYDDANSQYNSWNGSTGDLSNGLISPYQGFWIQSGGSGTSFSFTSSCKSTSVGTFYRTMSDSSGSVAFQLSSGSYNTTAYLSFNIDALEGIDNADAYKLLPFGANGHLTSMFYVGEEALNTSNLPYDITNPMTADMDVMLLTAANDSFYTNTGDVSMSWDIGSMPDDMTIHLIDQITLDTVDIQAVGSYTFALVEKGGFSSTGSTSPALYPRQGQNRFKVLVNSTTVSVDEELMPIQYALHQNYPNPFNPTTTLRYDIPETGLVNIIIYDMLGRQIKTLINQTQDAGYRSVIWDATNDYGKSVSTGIYLYQIQASKYLQTKKMVLLK